MGSIINRDGRWRALVRRKGHAAQCRTFGTQAEAKAWVRRIEALLGALCAPAGLLAGRQAAGEQLGQRAASFTRHSYGSPPPTTERGPEPRFPAAIR